MRKIIFFALISLSYNSHADKIIKFMNVANTIPRMEMKPDANSQAWARSARNILLLTSESIWESLYSVNQMNTQTGTPLFCIPSQETVNAEKVSDIIQETYKNLNMSEAEKNQLTVAQVALMGLQRKYACQPSTRSQPFVQIHTKKASLAQKMLHVAKPA